MPLYDCQLNAFTLIDKLAGYKAHEGPISTMQYFDTTGYVRW